jgi:hypothetical protein
MGKNIILIAVIVLCSCERQPDFVVNGQGYWINSRCVKSHVESKYGPHYGYNVMKGKYEFHTGSYSETVCDSTVIDTVKIPKK